jgi:hypothetical protein
MKVLMICVVVGAGVFLAGFLQMGMLKSGGKAFSLFGIQTENKEAEPGKFPDDLATAVRSKAVEKAAAFKPGPAIHKMAIMTPEGQLHRWHESVPEDWRGKTVEETELVVVVDKPWEIRLSRMARKVAGSDTPVLIDRVRHDVKVSVIEAKTGKVLDNRIFRNEARDYRLSEAAATRVIGSPVQPGTVIQWISDKSKTRLESSSELEIAINPVD